MALFDNIEGRVSKERILKLLKADPLLRKSLGIKMQYTVLKRASILLGIWAVVLFLTPLPEQLLLGRIGLAMLVITLGACWASDLGFQAWRLDNAADSLTKILRKNPKIRLTEGRNKAHADIEHTEFNAICSQLSQLELKAMLEVETEVKTAVSDMTQGRKRQPLFSKENKEAQEMIAKTRA